MWAFARAGLLPLALLALDAFAQPAPREKHPPSLPPQASEKAQAIVPAKTAPTVSVTAPATGALYTAPASVVLEAAAAASSSGKSITQVEFFAGTQPIGTVTAAPYTFNWSNVAAGSYSITARAMDERGGTATSGPVAVLVNAPPSVSLVTNGAVFTAPASVSLTADVTDTDGTIAQVEFFNGGTLVATRTAAPYSVVLTDVPQGAYSLSARVTDNHGAVTTSGAVSVTVDSGVAQIYFVHTDHLNTPRLITNNVGQVVWSWANDDPFGANMPNENPSDLGSFTCNLRLPGQYFDRETNLHYNYFRDYSPRLGRYVQSDPIGLWGDLNTYLYVAGDPLGFVDPIGLLAFSPMRPTPRYSNGNFMPGFSPQKPNCDLFPARFENVCVRNCCDVHDSCYTKHQCNASSWFGNYFGFSRPCQQCNAVAQKCVQTRIRNCNACS